jgi:hypothetical protein
MCEQDVIVIDLDKVFLETLIKAAGESNWIPHEHYFMNDWISDCANFLRYGGVIDYPNNDTISEARK